MHGFIATVTGLRSGALALAVVALAACSAAPGGRPPDNNASGDSAASAGVPGGGPLVDPASGARCMTGQDVRITRDGFSTVLEGECGRVTIAASDGSLNLDRAASIRVEGRRVTVLNERVDTLEAAGADGSFNMTEVGHAVVSGDGNTLLGRRYDKVSFQGRNNAVNTDNEPVVEDRGTGNKVI